MVARLSTIKEVTFEIDDYTENKSFTYDLRECSARHGDEEVRALVESRIGSEAKILFFKLLLTAIKDGKKFRQEAFRFMIAGLAEIMVEINVGQHKCRLICTNAYYKYFQTSPNHKWL